MFDGEDLCFAFLQCRCAQRIGDVPGLCRHFRSSGQVASLENDSCPRSGGMHGHGDRHAGVETQALVRDIFPDGVLISFHNLLPLH